MGYLVKLSLKTIWVIELSDSHIVQLCQSLEHVDINLGKNIALSKQVHVYYSNVEGEDWEK